MMPREKLAKYGAATLTDLELLLLVIGSGNKQVSARVTATQILKLLKEKGSEVTQYLLVDGVIRGAVMGHFRYGPYDLHAVWLELPEQEAAVRRDEILRAVYAVNGPREEPPPFVPVG